VLPSEIQGLKNRRGYLHFAEQNRVRRVKIPLYKRKVVTAPFEPREPLQNNALLVPRLSVPLPPPAPAPMPMPKAAEPRRLALDADEIMERARRGA
jgi:hypothetical protein